MRIYASVLQKRGGAPREWLYQRHEVDGAVERSAPCQNVILQCIYYNAGLVPSLSDPLQRDTRRGEEGKATFQLVRSLFAEYLSLSRD